MFGLGPATKIYISLDAVDMRKGFDGLYGLVRDHLGQDPQSGHLFSVHQPLADARESAGVGRQRAVGVRQTAGAGPLRLARRQRSAQRHHAAGRTGDAGERPGSDAGASAQELDPHLPGSITRCPPENISCAFVCLRMK